MRALRRSVWALAALALLGGLTAFPDPDLDPDPDPVPDPDSRSRLPITR